jgi:hypothetical protein
MPDDLGGLITTLGIPLGVVIWVAIGVIKLATEHGPTVVKRYQDRRADQDEHQQDIEQRRLRHEELMELTEAGSRTYTEEQLTHHLSELYVEFQAVNAFVREIVSGRLVEIVRKLDQVLLDVHHIPLMIERLSEVRMYAKALNERLVWVTDVLEKLHDETSFQEAVDPAGGSSSASTGVDDSVDEVAV